MPDDKGRTRTGLIYGNTAAAVKKPKKPKKPKVTAQTEPSTAATGTRPIAGNSDRKHLIDEQRRQHPEDYPDLDFHQTWGSNLTRKNPISEDVDADVAAYWEMLSKTPALLQHQIAPINNLYSEQFARFFGVDPISLHGHVSDVADPYLLTSLLTHLEKHSGDGGDEAPKLMDAFNYVHARIAVTDRSYGSGSGPLAYESVVPDFRETPSGERPFLVDTRDADQIDERVQEVKGSGCVALITEIVRNADGSVMSVEAWKNLVNACKVHNLVLIVDEALTAIRCGAPFAYQLERYAQSGRPDLILFGKAVKTCGIAIDWEGVNISRLQIEGEERGDVLSKWDHRYTEMAPIPDLLISTGTMMLAERENWPQRAQDIGALLREIIDGEDWSNDSTVGGLHSMIFLLQDHYKNTTSPVIGASAGTTYVRWLPTMDKVMTSRDELMTKVFGKESLPHRKETKEWFTRRGLKPRWCCMCGSNAENENRKPPRPLCAKCVARTCKNCEPQVKHNCPVRNVGR